MQVVNETLQSFSYSLCQNEKLNLKLTKQLNESKRIIADLKHSQDQTIYSSPERVVKVSPVK